MTYSVVAYDPDNGELGVACQSHFFAVGAAVNWAEPGVGVIASQALVEPAYGWRGLDLLRRGATAQQALDAVRADDALAEHRQVAVLDAHGDVAVHTGSDCIPVAGSRTGRNYSVQGNILSTERVLDDMAAAMEGEGSLADRLLAALQAAERAGGELRGSQAAGIQIVSATAPEVPWGGRLLDLRVDDAPDPVAELQRLLSQQRLAARVLGVVATDGMILELGSGTVPSERAVADAIALLADAAEEEGEVGVEAGLWHAVLLARSHSPRLDEARRALIARRPSMERLLAILGASGELDATHARSAG